MEMDETYMGGPRRGRRGRPLLATNRKLPSLASLSAESDRKGGDIAVTADACYPQPFCIGSKERVVPGASLFTDELHVFDDGLSICGMKAASAWAFGIAHNQSMADGVYVPQATSTLSSIEGFWSLLKNGISGVYHSVRRKYLQTYLDEYTFRYNRRFEGNLIFISILERVFERAS